MNLLNATHIPVDTSKNIVMLIDYRGQFYSSLRISTGGFDLTRIKRYFEDLGYELTIRHFFEIEMSERFDNTFILYQSSEDRDLHYKEYITDLIRHVENRGGIVIPSFDCFRAHENKLFQALLMQQVNIANLYVPKSQVFGCLEELKQATLRLSFPLVLKTSAGCQSQGVTLARSRSELLRKVKRLSRSFHLKDSLRYLAKRLLRKSYVPESLHRKKFVLQEFIPDLTGDYKVLVYWNKVFVLKRETRPNDFRASGSGRFSYEREVPTELLECAMCLREWFNCPTLSADIAFDEKRGGCVFIEIQFLMFGTYTLEKSEFHFQHDGSDWRIVEGSVVLENVFVEAVSHFLHDRASKLNQI